MNRIQAVKIAEMNGHKLSKLIHHKQYNGHFYFHKCFNCGMKLFRESDGSWYVDNSICENNIRLNKLVQGK